ncbi:MAG: hypothetical protein Q8L27_01625 [archaeon]|nr:hypothetical protein [archaeon]
MTKIIGYSLSGAGLIVIAFNKQIAGILSFLGTKAPLYTLMAGIILVIVGIALAMMNSSGSSTGNIKHSSEEVPIYEGTGKNRKIVGYHRSKK